MQLRIIPSPTARKREDCVSAASAARIASRLQRWAPVPSEVRKLDGPRMSGDVLMHALWIENSSC
ncbi:hypothetical protein NBG4_310024 [Candidatus Sulfobium mesophilum]|uniref:Uncharacterized protein n=1 Tax=Candidatus Sulfobium mesophilum TaxID=2016548 RepID=A0A2U3QH67_9BACT|nr:hypothetical protein NBG4_310024 [Candidatus Sulfobium mesophilum]